MLRKRISTLALVIMMGISVVGCQSSKEAELENRVQQLEQQLEEQQQEEQQQEEQQQKGREEKDLTVKEKREVEKAKEAAKEVKKQGKAKDESTRKPRYWLGVYIGDFTDSEVEAMNKKIDKEIDKAIQEQFKDDNTNSDVDERNNYKPADNNYGEDYWKTDGDLPNGDYDDNDEPAIIEEQEDTRPECEKEYTPKVQEEEGEPELPPYVKENSKVTSDGNGNITITEPEVTE